MYPRPPKHEKACSVCGTMFLPASGRAKYCSLKCKNGTSHCKTCGKEFIPKRHTRRDWCSRECWFAWDGRREDRECPVCRKIFKRDTCTQKYCSLDCSNKAQRKPRNTVCLECGGYIKYSKNSKNLYCSKRCTGLARAAKGLEMHRGVSVAPEGHRVILKTGYATMKVGGRWIQEHRLVMEQKLDRFLYPNETIHHINGKKDDNRPENLELWCSGHPSGQRIPDLVAWAKEILARYDPLNR